MTVCRRKPVSGRHGFDFGARTRAPDASVTVPFSDGVVHLGREGHGEEQKGKKT